MICCMPCMLARVMSMLQPTVRGSGTGLWTGMFFLGQFHAPLVLDQYLAGLRNILLTYGGVAELESLVVARGAR